MGFSLDSNAWITAILLLQILTHDNKLESSSNVAMQSLTACNDSLVVLESKKVDFERLDSKLALKSK